MANAANILNDKKYIYAIIQYGTPVKILRTDSPRARQLKEYINKCGSDIYCYNLQMYAHINKGEHIYWYRLQHSAKLEIKVNQFRQKYWFWEPLKVK